MDTNSQEFQRAYADLVAAFVRFMSVVNPGNANREMMLATITSQFNQLLNVLNVADAPQQPQYAPQQPQYAPQQPQQPQYQQPQQPQYQQPQYYPPQQPQYVPQQPQAPQAPQAPQQPVGEVVVKYAMAPTMVGGVWKFKGADTRPSKDGELIDNVDPFIYKLTLDEANGTGTAEIVEINKSSKESWLNIIKGRLQKYLPADVCNGAESIGEGTSSLRSANSVQLTKGTMNGWNIAAGQKLDIIAN